MLAVLLTGTLAAHAGDTLTFRITAPWNSVRNEQGKYTRKLFYTSDSAWIALDYNQSKMLIARSYYSDTSVNGTFEFCHYYYDEQKGYLKEIRHYKKSRLNGIRAAFNEKGDTLRRENYVEGELKDSKNFPAYVSDKQSFALVEVPAEFPGGARAWINYLSQNLQYPRQAMRKNITGRVIVVFLISREGKVEKTEVIQSVDKLLDEEALRLIKGSPEWKPATQNGVKIASYMKQPIDFKLEDETPKKKEKS